MIYLKLYFLAGLVLHKVLWEFFKRTQPTARSKPPASARTLMVKAVKTAILLGILVQTMLPDVLPLSDDAAGLRLIGAILYTTGLAVAISARLQLGNNWSDIETARILPRQAVVAAGPYAYVRHPIYVGDLLLLLGLELGLNSWLVVGVVLMAPLVLRQAVREEQMLAASLPGYADYCGRTKRFIPFVV